MITKLLAVLGVLFLATVVLASAVHADTNTDSNSGAGNTQLISANDGPQTGSNMDGNQTDYQTKIKDQIEEKKKELQDKLDKGKANFQDKIDQMKDKLDKFKQQAKDRLDKLKETQDNWKQEKGKFPGLNMMLNSPEGKMATMQYIQVLGDQIAEHFKSLADKNGPLASYWLTKPDEINSIVANLDSNSTKEDILNAIQELKKTWQNNEPQRKAAIGVNYVDGVTRVVPKMENILNSLDKKLDTLEAAGIDDNTARTQYYLAIESIANLKLDLTNTQEQLKTKISDTNIDVNSINSLLKTLNVEVKDTRKTIVDAVNEFNKLKRDFAKDKQAEKDQNRVFDGNRPRKHPQIRDTNKADDQNGTDLNTEDDNQNTADVNQGQ